MRLPFNGDYGITPGRGFGNGHLGVDYLTPMRTPLVAAQPGKVTWAQSYNDGSGKAVTISNNGVLAKTFHMDEIGVRVGQVVNEGDHIGLSGNTGNSTGPHTHFQTERNGVPFNPYEAIVSQLKVDVIKEEDVKISNIHEERQLKSVALHRDVIRDDELGAGVGKTLKQNLDGVQASKEWNEHNYIIHEAFPAMKTAKETAEANEQLLKGEVEELKKRNSPESKAVRTGGQVAVALPAGVALGQLLEGLTNWVLPILQLPEVHNLFTNPLSWGLLTTALAAAFAWIQNKQKERSSQP